MIAVIVVVVWGACYLLTNRYTIVGGGYPSAFKMNRITGRVWYLQQETNYGEVHEVEE